MKWLVLGFALLVGVPWLASWLREDPRRRAIVIGIIAFDLFNPSHVNFFSDEHYRGDSRGYEITTVDLMALGIWMARDRTKASKMSLLWIPQFLYFTAAFLSAFASPDAFRSSFSIWKILRMYFLFHVLVPCFEDMHLVRGGLLGLTYGILTEGLLALQQKYVWGWVRVMGSLPHPNSLSMSVNLVSPIALSLLLSGKGSWRGAVVVTFSAMCNVFSLSRGGLLMYLGGTAVTVMVSLFRRPSVRSFLVVSVMFLGGAAAAIKSAPTIIARFENAPKESELARIRFNQAAQQMAKEHPVGIGINMYSYVLDHGGYAAPLGIDPGDRNGIAHHIYWLTAAEMGYYGLGCYLLLWLLFYGVALRVAFGKGLPAMIGLGIVVGLTCTYAQGTAEWIARQTPISYLMWIYAAMVVGLRRQQKQGVLSS